VPRNIWAISASIAAAVPPRQKEGGSEGPTLVEYIYLFHRIPLPRVYESRTLPGMSVRTKRASDPPASDDGVRVLVDRYWPRGIPEEEARVDAWMREIAPSPHLTAWYGHKAERWQEFKTRYWQELEEAHARDAVEQLREHAHERGLTLIYGARDSRRNAALALAEYLGEPIEQPGRWRPDDTPAHWYHVLQSFSVLEWMWVLFALSAPLVALVTVELLVVFGARGWLVFMTILALFSAVTVLRVLLRERRLGSPAAARHDGDRESVWVAVRDLSIASAAVVAGLAIVALGLAILAVRVGLIP
jgi:uncharacterized protein YeaO (DUF488 family)